MANFNQVLSELRAERNRTQHEIDNLDRAIRAIGGLSGKVTTRTISAAGRARIAAAQRARWAKARRGRASKAKRTLSAAGRERIAAAQRARWAKQRAEQKKAA